MIKDINYYRVISGIYNVNSPRDYYILNSQNEINDNFESCIAYEKVLIEGQERELLIMHKTNIYTDKGGIKFVTRPNEIVNIGDLINWNNELWLCTEVDPIKKIYCKGYIKRCNNMLRGLDENGKLHEYPCIFDEHISQTDFIYKDSINTAYGRTTVYVQANDFTSNILENRRFIFNKQAYKVTYIFNHIMSDITQLKPSGVIKIEMVKDQNSEDDDLVNMIANANSYKYSIVLNQSYFEGNIGDVGTIIPTIIFNNEVTSKEIVWSTDNDEIGIIDENGNYELLAEGIVNFKCSLKYNENIFAICTVNIKENFIDSIENTNIIFEGIAKNTEGVYVSEILQGGTKTYTVKKLINNIYNEEVLTIIDITTNIPNGYYTFVNNNDNTFSIKNIKRYDKEKVVIKATDGINESILQIQLKGVF